MGLLHASRLFAVHSTELGAVNAKTTRTHRGTHRETAGLKASSVPFWRSCCSHHKTATFAPSIPTPCSFVTPSSIAAGILLESMLLFKFLLPEKNYLQFLFYKFLKSFRFVHNPIGSVHVAPLSEQIRSKSMDIIIFRSVDEKSLSYIAVVCSADLIARMPYPWHKILFHKLCSPFCAYRTHHKVSQPHTPHRSRTRRQHIDIIASETPPFIYSESARTTSADMKTSSFSLRVMRRVSTRFFPILRYATVCQLYSEWHKLCGNCMKKYDYLC